MKSRNGSANPMLVLMLLASVVLNVAFVSGCKTIEKIFVKEKIVYRDNIDHVKRVADKLGMCVASNKTAGDVATDIRIVIDNSEQRMPSPLPDETITKLKKLLKPDERAALDDYQKAIKDAQGKKVLYIPVNDEE